MATSSANEFDLPLPADAVQVGRVAGSFGVRGELRIKPLSADPQALFSSKRWYLRPPEEANLQPRPIAAPAKGAAPLPPSPSLLKVVKAREQGGWVVASTQELKDPEAAQALAGHSVWVSRASFPTLVGDEFYWVDLIGLAVRNREGLVLGTVVGLLETGPSCVLRVKPFAPETSASAQNPVGSVSPSPKTVAPAEILIPFASAYVDEVNLPERLIQVDWQLDY